MSEINQFHDCLYLVSKLLNPDFKTLEPLRQDVQVVPDTCFQKHQTWSFRMVYAQDKPDDSP